MKDIDKQIKIADQVYPSVKDYFKEVLVLILIDEPPKRLLGDSGWWHDLATGLAKSDILKGGVSPCCKDFKDCGGEESCSYEYNAESKDIDKTLKRLIDSL